MDRRKLLMIFGGAWVSAALLTWFLYSATSDNKTLKLTKVIAASRDLSAGSRLRKGDLKTVEVPQRDLPRGYFPDETTALDRTLVFPVSLNEPITQNKISSVGGIEGVSALIAPGKRAVSVQVSDSTGAAGLIQPRAHVDVIFTRSGSLNEAVSKVILQDVVVLSVGRTTEVATGDKAAAANAAQQQPSTQQRAVTLLVTPEEAAKLELAKNNGKIGLAMRNPMDRSRMEEEKPTYGDVLDPYLGARKDRMARAIALNAPVRDDKAWAGLTARKTTPSIEKKTEEAVKAPRVVDVFRGDKHVQEVFEK